MLKFLDLLRTFDLDASKLGLNSLDVLFILLLVFTYTLLVLLADCIVPLVGPLLFFLHPVL